MPDTIILDPTEVSTGRTQLDISGWVDAEGANWGDGEISAYLADQTRGSTPVDFRVPNRQITLPLNLRALGGVSHSTIRTNLQRKVSRIQQEGGWIRRTTATGTLFADVVNATLTLGGSWMQSRANNPVDTEAELKLECIPDWYGAEILLPDRPQGFIWTETGILGDYPGRMRLIVDNDGPTPQQGLFWGVRSRHYSSASTAALLLLGNNCTPLDTATIQGGSIRHPAISTMWTPVLSTHQTGGVALTHTGTYTVWARMNALPANSVPLASKTSVRLLWDVGDFLSPEENDPVYIPTDGFSRCVSLGQVRLDRVPSGTHRWQGIVQARGLTGTEVFTITEIFFQPVDEGAGVLRAPLVVDPGLGGFLARDEFNQSAGVLTGKTLPVGGTWQGAGSTTDFTVEASGRTAYRLIGADANLTSGRHMTAGTSNYTTVVTQVDFRKGGYESFRAGLIGVLVRWNSATVFAVAGLQVPNMAPFFAIFNGSATSATYAALADPITPQPGQWYTVRVSVDTQGRFIVWLYPQGGATGAPVLSGQNTLLTTGQALQTGRVGFYDVQTSPNGGGVSTTQDTRSFDNFSAWVPQQDAVVFPGQSAEIRTEGVFREDSTGATFGPAPPPEGDLPRMPPAGTEGRTCQWIVKCSRGDLDTLPDMVNDPISARLAYRPSYLLTN